MRNNIAAGSFKVFITAISVFALLPLDGDINRVVFVAVFVYLLSRGGECVFSLMNEKFNNSVMRTVVCAIMYFVGGAMAAMFSWGTEFLNSIVAFFALYIVCALTLLDDVTDVILSAKSYELIMREINKKNS